MKNTKTEIRINEKTFASIAIVYLVLPVIIFFIGYLKFYIGIPFALLTAASTYLYIRGINTDSDMKPISEKSVSLSPIQFIAIPAVMILMCFIGGIGEFVWSTSDHSIRWAILKDLIDYKWPVIYDFANQSNPLVRDVLGEGKGAFAYYFTFWMVSAVIGKIFGLMAARIFLVLWSALGMFLIYCGLYLNERRKPWLILLAFFLFGGQDFIPYLIKSRLDLGPTWEGWNNQLYVHGTYSQLMNVFHQSIPGWLTVLLLMRKDNNRSVGFVGALMFCYSPWATIGLLPVAICQLVRREHLCGDKKRNFKNILGFNNLIVPMIILVSYAPLYTANPAATSVKGFMWEFIPDTKTLITSVLLYFIIEFGIWALIVYKNEKSEPLYWVFLGEMFLFPLYNISDLNDFMMRGTMAPMFILMVMVIHKLIQVSDELKEKNKDKSIAYIICFVGIISAVTQFNLITASVNFTITDNNVQQMQTEIGSFGDIKDEKFTDLLDLQFFVEGYEDSFFFKYLAK